MSMEIKLKQVVDEDFVNYKKPSMFLLFPKCNWKCEKECGKKVCQNSELANKETISISISKLLRRYDDNDITSAIVCGGLEPFDSWDELFTLVERFRLNSSDDVVIYTGYNKDEIEDYVRKLSKFPNIIIKYGRYIPDADNVHDECLGVTLASDNQYAEKLVSEDLKIKVNPDKEFADMIRQNIKDNDGYCPCSIKKSDDTKCMCKDFREQNHSGYCHCQLYYKTDGHDDLSKEVHTGDSLFYSTSN